MMHPLYSYLLALYLILVPGLPAILPGSAPETPAPAADTLRHAAAAVAAPIPGLTFTTDLVFLPTGVGYYRDGTIVIEATRLVSLAIRPEGNAGAFEFPSTFPQSIDTPGISILVRYSPAQASVCDSMRLIIISDTTTDTIRISGCPVDAHPPFNRDTTILFGTIMAGDSISRNDILMTAPGGPVTYRCALRDSQQFSIAAPTTDSVNVSDTAGSPIILMFHPTAPGTFADTLMLRTTIGDYAVGMRGTAVAISSAIDSVRFVTDAADSIYIVYVGESHTIVDSIENRSSESFIAHHDLVDPGGGFAVTSQPDFTLAANFTDGVTLRFAPPAMGDYTAHDTLLLTGRSNQQLRGSVTRTYKGRGVQAILQTSADTLRFAALQPGLCESGKAVEELSVRLTNIGNIGMKVLYSLERQGSEFSIVDPVMLDTIRLDSAGRDTITIRLCGWDSIAYSNTLVLYDARTSTPVRRVALIHDKVGGGGQADSALLRVAIDTLSFGEVQIDSTAIDSIIITNFGNVAGVIDTGMITGGNSGDFRIVTPTARNISVPPRSSVAVVIAFTPGSLGARASNWEATWDGGKSTPRIVLIGTGVRAQNPAPDTFRTASFPKLRERVGNRIRMPLSLSTGTSAEWDWARIVIDPMALRLESIEPAGLTYGRANNDSLITVYRPGGTPLTSDGTLFTLVFTGLSTGRPVNIVAIDTIRGPVPIASGADGVVELDGCDVGKYGGFSSKPSIGALRVEPGGGSAELTYQAADGAIPAIALFDLGGTELLRRTLPTANGGAQTLWLSLRDIPRGIYWLELRVESDRLVTPIIINR